MSESKQAILKFTIGLGMLLATYFPTFIWMYNRWMAHVSYYSHGIFIPFISLYILWQRRELLMKTEISPDMRGMVMVLFGLMIHAVCVVLKIYFLSAFSFVFVLYGLILFIFGPAMAGNVMFPVLFLAAMVPLPLVLISNMVVKLKLMAAGGAVFILSRIGFPSILDGSTIRMATSSTEVAAPCSGLRSLIALITLGLLFAFNMKGPFLKKGALLLISVPIAMATNVMRIVFLAIVNDLYGGDVASGFLHDLSGFLVFAMAFVLLLWVSGALSGESSKH